MYLGFRCPASLTFVDNLSVSIFFVLGGFLALHIAASNGRLEIAKLLLDHGVVSTIL